MGEAAQNRLKTRLQRRRTDPHHELVELGYGHQIEADVECGEAGGRPFTYDRRIQQTHLQARED
jgi:hypothetical protein